MKFVRAIWKLLVGIKDALVLILLIFFFAGLYGALSAKPAPVKDGVLNLNLNGSVVEQPSRREWADVAGTVADPGVSPARPRSSARQGARTTAG